MAKDNQKRLGKKHRHASTRPKKGRAPKASATTGAVAPKTRKRISNKQSATEKLSRLPKQSPERESRVTLRVDQKQRSKDLRPATSRPASENSSELRDWREAELQATRYDATVDGSKREVLDAKPPLIAICGRPNVGKSTLFNRLTGSRRSIVGDEPGITRDRIYGEIEWAGRNVRVVDTGGVIPDDEALIPSEIFRQAQVALGEADAIVMVVDGRTELAAPDIELARLLLRGGKPVFLAVNKMDSADLLAGAENFRSLGLRDVLPISAEHGTGIGDLLDEVFAALPPETVDEEPSEVMLTAEDEMAEDEDGPVPPRKLRTHGEYEQTETKIAIIGRPNVGKSTLLNALTGTKRAIVSPIAGTTRDAVDEVVERGGHSFRFVDTAGIRRKGKTKLMAEKLSVVMARKHLEAADVSLLVVDAIEGVTALDANIGGYAHESGRSVIIVVNKWDAVTTHRTDGKPPADKKVYEQQVRDALKYLDYAPLLFISAAEGMGVDQVFKKVELVARERRKRISTGNMNRFLENIDFQKASLPMSKRIRVYYMTQAAVAPPTFVLFTDKDVKLHFSFERFLANQIREKFGFIGSPIWFKIKARNKKKAN
ncbi:ribosome biogenesis GTPase Der [Edaphobacter albus]|uniref:ribosome biogenesis GTPase Der n=1 Tax=Edaphobacter sp. 4G125 TaxID=2763071 RepID=UPI001644BE20|nr:ribosome biogenesis GTPase Der [Edaphobacter sp. 4G125]QNI36280.1 ribosome biogenesis GTPase Der [Edaphobacter sp. 4G125]